MARSKDTYRHQAQSAGSALGAPTAAPPRPLNMRSRTRTIDCRWLPDVESDLGNDAPISKAELEAIWQLLGEDLDRFLDD